MDVWINRRRIGKVIAAAVALVLTVSAGVLALAADAPAPAAPPTSPFTPDAPKPDGPPPVRVVLETTKGDIVLAVHADWAPLGSKHFLELVRDHFYDGAPWFRVLDGFVAQCGIAADPAANEKWGEQTIKDEPLKQGNKRGTVAFGKSGAPNSRSTHIFINYADNSSALDPQGFACFAEVVDGMKIADKLTRCEYNDQHGLGLKGGLATFKKMYPKADYIKRAYVKDDAAEKPQTKPQEDPAPKAKTDQ